VSESIQIEGVPVHVTDTAGLRHDEQAADEVERIGIGRSWEAIRAADCVLFLHDLTRAGQDAAYDAAERDIETSLPPGVSVIHVWNKADAVSGSSETPQDPPQDMPAEGLRLSARTGQGLEALRQALLRTAGWQAAPEGVFIARARHVQALQRCAQHLAPAQAHLAEPAPALDLLAEELRLAHQALGDITGAFTAENLLGEIFSKFCIGK
jgi:tRNA modification GTPase